MTKFILILSAIVFSFPTLAAEKTKLSQEQEQQQIKENIDKVGQELTKNIQEASKQLTVAIPAITNNLSDIFNSFTTEMVPVIKALEENRHLIEASDSMAQALQTSLPTQYQQSLSYKIDHKNNELSLDGTIAENQDKIRFNITRNLAATMVTQNLITQTNQVEEANFYKPGSAKLPGNKEIKDIDNRSYQLDKFKLELINENAFMVHEDMTKQETFIFGNLNPVLNLRVQSSGPNHNKKIREFITNLDLPKIEQAVNHVPQDNEEVNISLSPSDNQK